MTKVLIVGANGFLGANFSNWFMCHTIYDIVGIDNRSKFKNWLPLQPNLKSKRYNLQISNVLDKDIFNKILDLESPDYIIFTTEFNISCMALSSIETKIPNLKKIVVILDHAWDKLPNSILPVVGVFADNVFGSRQHSLAFIPAAIKASLLNTHLTLKLSPMHRDWIYAKDVFSAIEILLESGKVGTSYKISSESKFTREEILNKIFKIVGIKPKYDVNWYREEIFDFGLETIENWKQEFTIDSALEHTICWYDTNKWIFESVANQ